MQKDRLRLDLDRLTEFGNRLIKLLILRTATQGGVAPHEMIIGLPTAQNVFRPQGLCLTA